MSNIQWRRIYGLMSILVEESAKQEEYKIANNEILRIQALMSLNEKDMIKTFCNGQPKEPIDWKNQKNRGNYSHLKV